MKVCKVEGCGGETGRRGGKKHGARGWCEKHYQRWQKHGDPMTTLQREPGMMLAEFCEWARGKMTRWFYGCELWTGAKTASGYGGVLFAGRNRGVHTLIAEHYHGPAPDGRPFACHICGNKSCINPAHIYWGSPRDNTNDHLCASPPRERDALGRFT